MLWSAEVGGAVSLGAAGLLLAGCAKKKHRKEEESCCEKSVLVFYANHKNADYECRELEKTQDSVRSAKESKSRHEKAARKQSKSGKEGTNELGKSAERTSDPAAKQSEEKPARPEEPKADSRQSKLDKYLKLLSMESKEAARSGSKQDAPKGDPPRRRAPDPTQPSTEPGKEATQGSESRQKPPPTAQPAAGPRDPDSARNVDATQRNSVLLNPPRSLPTTDSRDTTGKTSCSSKETTTTPGKSPSLMLGVTQRAEPDLFKAGIKDTSHKSQLRSVSFKEPVYQ